MRKLDLNSVNWWDGMNVSQMEFIAQEHYHDESLTWLRRNGLSQYGLISGRPGDHPALEISTSLEGGKQLRVEILNCRAITRDGSVIEVSGDHSGGTDAPLVGLKELSSPHNQVIPVYIRVTGDKRSAGQVDPTGHAARQIWEYQVVLAEQEVTDDGSALKVAEFIADGYEITLVDQYIPPCFTCGATSEIHNVSEQISTIAQESHAECCSYLGGAGIGLASHPLQLAIHRTLTILATGWATTLDSLLGWETAAPSDFIMGVKGWLRAFSTAMVSFPAAKLRLDEKLLQAGGLPTVAGGIDFHDNLTSYLNSAYAHEDLGGLFNIARNHMVNIQSCLRFLGEEMGEDGGEAIPAPRPKVTYRQQDYYLLDVGEIDKSFSPETQVLYFKSLATRTIRSVLFVLRNNAATGVDARDVRLKGGVNEDRQLFCPDLVPDFQERPGQIYLLMEVEPGKRDAVDYFSLRSSGTVDLSQLLAKKDTDIRVYYL